jgi:hypothetical protein
LAFLVDFDVKKMTNAQLMEAWQHHKSLDKDRFEKLRHEMELRISRRAVFEYFAKRWQHYWQIECLLVEHPTVPKGHIDAFTGRRILWIAVPPLPAYLKTSKGSPAL